MLAGNRVDRRDWLRSAALSSLGGGGLVWGLGAGQPPDGDREASACNHPLLAGEKCPQLLRFSKDAQEGSRVLLTPIKPCPCEPCAPSMSPVVRASFRAKFPLVTSGECDERRSPAAGEVLFDCSGVLVLRTDMCPKGDRPDPNDPHGTVVIGAACGDFTLIRGDTILFKGTLCGTSGFAPMLRGMGASNPADRCCQHGVGLGSLCGDGVNDRTKSWLLKATYRSHVEEIAPEKICQGTAESPFPLEIRMAIDGLLIGPCG